MMLNNSSGLISQLLFNHSFIIEVMPPLKKVHMILYILIVIYTIFALLCLGTGMSLIMVYNSFISGMVIGIIGIILLVCLIPMCKGFK